MRQNGLERSIRGSLFILGLCPDKEIHRGVEFVGSGTGWVFALFVILLFGTSYILVNRASEMDRYID